MSIEDELSERQARDEAAVSRLVWARLNGVERLYRQGLTSLWLGNGAAAVAVLSFIVSASRDGKFPGWLLWPLTCFVLGLVAMGLGTIIYLWSEGLAIRSMEEARSLLGIKTGQAKRPTESAGLSLRDVRTVMGIISAVLFVAGCTIGLIDLWVSN